LTVSTLQQRRDLALGAGAELFYDTPLEIVRGEGAYLFDAAGRRYVDLYNNVPCVGHGNAAVARAMAEQQARLNVHSRYLHEGIVSFAERLTGLHHDGIESVVFSCSGTEANEVALRMARVVTGQRGIVCADQAYHGNAGLVDALTCVGRDTGAGNEIRGFPFPQRYRPLELGLGEQALCEVYLERVGEAIRNLKAHGHGFAALIACSIFANEGLPSIPVGFMARLTELVQREGGLMIADEVQSGYGRTGRWWGYEYENFQPDIVVMGKPMGNGLPLAATAASREHVEAFRAASGYFNTFASSPLQAAVGMTVLDEIERLDLLRNAAEMGGRLQRDLASLAEGRQSIGDVRGSGLFISIEMVSDRASKTPDPAFARQLAERLKDLGFLLSCAGAFDNVVKIRPPLVFGEEHARPFLEAFEACLVNLHG
jgi:4-aminobutyrate aminotransferase-like enzyme